MYFNKNNLRKALMVCVNPSCKEYKIFYKVPRVEFLLEPEDQDGKN